MTRLGRLRACPKAHAPPETVLRRQVPASVVSNTRGGSVRGNMPDVGFYRTLYAYNRSVLESYVRAAEHRSWKASVRDVGIGHLSVT